MCRRYIVVLGLCLFVILYYLWLFQYNFPSKDDFLFAMRAEVFTPMQSAMDFYNTWNGRLTANFFYTLFMKNLNLDMFRVYSVLVYILMCASIVGTATLFYKNARITHRIMIGVMLLAVILLAINPRDTIYMMGCITNYTLGITFLFSSWFLLLFPRFHLILRVPAAVLLFLGCLCNEPLTLIVMLLHMLFTAAAVLNGDKKAAALNALFFFVATLAMIVLINSGGNSVRMAGDIQPDRHTGLYITLLLTLKEALVGIFEWGIFVPLIPVAFISTLLLKGGELPLLLKKRSLCFNGAALILIGITCEAGALFPRIFMLQSGGTPGRVRMMAVIFFVVFAFWGLICLIRCFKLDERFASKKAANVVLIVFVLTLLGSKYMIPSMLYIGTYDDYYNGIRQRLEYLDTAKENYVVFRKLPYAPRGFQDLILTPDCDHVVNRYLSDMYNKDCVKIEEGRDGDENPPDVMLKKLFGI